MQVLDVILQAVLSMGLTYAFVRCDRIRMTDRQRERGWNAATTGAAIFTFAPLCILAHFWVTRRSVRGILAGIVAFVFLLTLQTGLTLLYQEAGLHWLVAVIVFCPVVPTLLPLMAVSAWL